MTLYPKHVFAGVCLFVLCAACCSESSLKERSGRELVYPAQLLDLTNFKLTLPIGSSSNPSHAIEIRQPILATYTHDTYFHLNDTKNGVVFQAHCGGAATSSRAHPRSELREMANNGRDKAAWSTTSGTHTMIVTEAITHLPLCWPRTVSAQIHNANNDLIVIQLHRNRLYVDNNGTELGNLDTNYVLGTRFTIKIVAANGQVKVFYNDMDSPKVLAQLPDTGCYFKVGNYTQSDLSKGDAPDAYGEVVIYDLKVSHEP